MTISIFAKEPSPVVERLVGHGYRPAALPSWFDVDDEKDLERLTALLREGAVHADETARVLGIT